jgi:cystathionine beta-lyase family protein involved in aluminum resistance
LSISGKPYDTLEEVIGLQGAKNTGSLIDYKVKYEQIDLLDGGGIDIPSVRKRAKSAKVIYIQRSRGYSMRPSLDISQIEKAANAAKEVNPGAIVLVDNCYGELR